MLRAALLLLSGNATASLLTLARNLVLVRLIPVEDYGVAATLAIAMAVVEMASHLGLQQQIVQAREGEGARFQAALQGFQVLRGVLAGLALWLLAGPLAAFLGIPEAAWAYRALALVPVLRALQHFDIHRLNRAGRFGPSVLTGTVPALLSLLAIWPLALATGDWRAMLWALLVQAGAGLVVSHLAAERAYRLAWDREIVAGALRFGWPLLVNGALLFAAFQGDKLIVGRELGMAPLAVFAMGVTLTLTPTLVAAASAQTLFLPRLSRAAGGADPAAFAEDARAALQAALLCAGGLAVAALWLGPALVGLLLGPDYAALGPLLAWFALLQGVRMLKTAPAVAALAAGRTEIPMLANLPRVAALALVWWVAVEGGGFVAILAVGLGAEALGFGLSLWLVRRATGLSWRPVWPVGAAVAGVLAAVVVAVVAPGLGTTIGTGAGLVAVGLLGAAGAGAGALWRVLRTR